MCGQLGSTQMSDDLHLIKRNGNGWMRSLAALCLVSLLLTCSACGYNMLVLNDMHMMPNYQPRSSASTYCSQYDPSALPAPYGRYQCDSPFKLVKETIDEAKRINDKPSMIILGGDLGGHGSSSWQETYNTVANVTKTIYAAFPHTPVIPMVGNDDVYPDYMITSQHLNEISILWQRWLMPDELKTFRHGGYYKRELSSSLHVIVVNSLLFSSRISQTGLYADHLSWLDATVAKSAKSGANMIFMGHIPPGSNGFDKKQQWSDDATRHFLGLVKKHRDNVSGMYFFHQHEDLHRVIGDGDAFALISPSVTPDFGNNPGFRIMHWKADGQLYELEQYVADLISANINDHLTFELEYTMSAAYGKWMKNGVFTASTANGIQQEIIRSVQFWDTYYDRVKAANSASGRMAYACSTVVDTPAEFQQCLKDYPWNNAERV